MPELTVGSLNLHWGRGPKMTYAPYDVVAAARSVDTDVLVLQESWATFEHPGQHDRIAGALGYEVAAAEVLALGSEDPFPHPVARARDPQRRRPRSSSRRPASAEPTGTWSVAILSRLPVTGRSTMPFRPLRQDAVSRSLLRVDVDVDGTAVSVFGTHMAHLYMWSILHAPALRGALAAAPGPAVLAGDLNMWAWCTPLYVPRGWRRRGTGRTYPAAKPWARIDHLLVNPAAEVREAEVLADVGSDHRPIRARLVVA